MKVLLFNLFIASIVFSFVPYATSETGLSVPKNKSFKDRIMKIYLKVQNRVNLIESKNVQSLSKEEIVQEAVKQEHIPHDVFRAVEFLLDKNTVVFVSDKAKASPKISNSLMQFYKPVIKDLAKEILSITAKSFILKGESAADKLYSLVGLHSYLEKQSKTEYQILSFNPKALPTIQEMVYLEEILSKLSWYLGIKFVAHLDTVGEFRAGMLAPEAFAFLLHLDKINKKNKIPFMLNFTTKQMNDIKRVNLYEDSKFIINYTEIKPLSSEQIHSLVSIAVPKIEAKHSVSITEKVVKELVKVAPTLFPNKDLFSSIKQLLNDMAESTSSKKVDFEYTKEYVEKKYNQSNIFNQGLSGVDLSNKKDVLKVVLNVGDLIKSDLIGQDDAVTKVSQAIESHYMKKERKMPLSIFAVGLTGVGKTEMGNLIAKYLYGSNSFANFSLGNFSHIGDLNNLFGSAKGYVGSNEISEFEKFLSEHPVGGVIIFDEASNMGGENKEQKNAMFKRFYEMLEEGKWTAPKSGTTYELGNYVFLFTGNDGEKIFQGVSNEAYKEILWKQNNSREKIFKMLTSTGVPEAFLGRLSEVFLFKPVTKKTATKIAEKFIKDFEKNYEIKVQYTNKEQFFTNLVQAIFFASEGARSVRSFVENRLGSYIVRAAESALKNGETLNSVRLGWKDNLKARVYAARSFKRKSSLSISISTDKKPKYSTPKVIDLSGDILKADLPTIAQIKETAYHEAGHGFLSYPAQTGKNLEFISVVPGKTSNGLSYLGVAVYDIDSFTGLTYKNLITRVAGLLAGGMAEKMAGYNLSSGWSNDLLQIRKLIQAAFLTGPVIEGKGFEFIRVKGEANEVQLTQKQERLLHIEVEKVISSAKKRVVKTLEEKWSNVEKVVDLLMKKGTIDAKEFYAIANDKTIRSLWKVDSHLKMRPLASCKNLF